MKEMNGDVGYVEDVGDDWADIRFQAVTTFNELLRLKKPRLEEKLSWLRLLQASAGVERISFPNHIVRTYCVQPQSCHIPQQFFA